MALPNHQIIEAIEKAPLNCGLKGADWLARQGNIPVTFDDGDVALFDHEGERTYQVHFLFKSRGRKAIEHAKQAFRIMFTEHDADLIFGLTPVILPHARLFNRWIGGRSAGFRDTSEGRCELYVLSKFQWKVANQ